MRIDENAQRQCGIITVAGPGLNSEELQHLGGRSGGKGDHEGDRKGTVGNFQS